MASPTIGSISPFFIVRDVSAMIAFYEDKLGFRTNFREPDNDPFFAILERDGAMLFVKSGGAAPQPNTTRDPEMRWDAYCFTQDPDALATEFTQRGTPFSESLHDTSDGLRGFEVTDPDGYVLFFGRPLGA